MDILKLKICTRFMKGFFARLCQDKIYKHFKFKTNINFKDISVDTLGQNVIIHVNGYMKVNRTELERFLDKI